jgi:ribosomal protein S18 acetylase RimI-like enzyme
VSTAAGGGASRVRPAEQGDVPAMMALHERCWRISYAGIADPTWLVGRPLAEREREWRRRLIGPGHPTWVAEADGEVVGFVVAGPAVDEDAGPDDGQVLALYVDPDHQRDGHGRALLAHATAQLAAAGFTAASLWTLRDNPGSRAFYEAQGWEADGAEQDRGLGVEVRYVRQNLHLASISEAV